MTQVWIYKRTATCSRYSCKWLLKVQPFATVFGRSILPNVVKKQACQWPLTFEKKHSVSTNWPNIAAKFAKRGALRSLLPLNWSSWRRATSATQLTEFESNDKRSTSPGESSARLPAGLRPHRHWCLCQSTWSAQKVACWDQQPPEKMAYRQKVCDVAFVEGRPTYHLDGATCKISYQLQKTLAW